MKPNLGRKHLAELLSRTSDVRHQWYKQHTMLVDLNTRCSRKSVGRGSGRLTSVGRPWISSLLWLDVGYTSSHLYAPVA